MSRSVIVTLKANVDGFIASIAKAQAAANKMAGSLSEVSRGADWGRVSSDLLKVGAAATAAVGLVSKAAISWQSDWAGVQKTVDGTTEQMAVLEDQLRGMARSMPATHTEIAAVAEAAGQLGVATEDVAKFSEVMIQLGETTNLSADTAATSIAQFTNIMGTSRSEVGRLGATLVQLGNNGASTEADIMALGQRLAGVGAQMNMTEADVLGFANAMTSVGIEAESGGTAMTLTLKGIDAAVRTGGRELETYARTAGMTAEQFAKAWGDDAAEATAAFVEGLGEIQGAGGDVNQVLSELGINGIRQSDSLIRLAGATKAAGGAQDMLRDSLEMGARAWDENTALTDEYGKRTETAAAQIQVAWNNVKDATISAGQSTLPAIAGITTAVSDVAQRFGDLPPVVHTAGLGLTGLVGAGALAAGGVMKAVTAAAEFNSALAAMPTHVQGGVRAFGRLGAAAGLFAASMVAVQMAGAAIQNGIDDTLMSEAVTKQAIETMARYGHESTAMSEAFETAMAGTTGHTKDLAGAVDMLANSNGFARWVDRSVMGLAGMKGNIEMAEEEIAKLDAALTTTSPEKAGQAFQVMADQVRASGGSVGDLTAQFGDYRASLEETAAAIGVHNLGEMEMQAWMEGTVPRAVEVARLMAELGVAHVEAGASAEEQAAALSTLTGLMHEQANAALAASSADIAYHQALDRVADVAEQGGAAVDELSNRFDTNTEAGQMAQSAIDGVAAAAWRNIDAMEATGESAQDVIEYTAAVAEYTATAREEFIEAAKSMGMGSEAANQLADDYGLIPPTVTTDVSAPGATLSKEQAGAFYDALMKIPPEKRAEVRSAFRRGGVDAAYDALNAIDGRVANTFVRTYYETVGAPPNHWAGGGLTRAFGGPIFGPGTSTSDSVPAMLSTGEHVLTAREVDALGGHTAIYRLRAAALAGKVQRFAAGGPVTPRAALPDRLPQTWIQPPAANQQPPVVRTGPILVENPWTGEYHEARMRDMARSENSALASQRARQAR